MEMVARLNNGISRLSVYITASKRRTLCCSIVIYTLIFAAFFCVSALKMIIDKGTILGVDGVFQFYPYLLDLRRNTLSFIESVKNGSPQLTMMNFNFSYGIDTFTSTTVNFMPLLPFYLLSVFFAESDIPMFFAVGIVLLMYASGIAFLYLCRYFKQNMLIAGLIAPFYVLCGSTFHTVLYYPQFYYMFIAFPLMIVGIDKIVNGKGWVLFALSTGWLALSGFVMLVYTIPFVVVYAIIRVYFIYKGAFFKKLFKYAAKGCLAMLLGVAMAGFAFLPYIMEYLLSGRTSTIANGLIGISVAELFIPSLDYLDEMFSGLFAARTGVSAVLTPLFLLVIISPKVRKELKCCIFAMLILVSLPVVWYGLNGFQYELCRWGFVPALLCCFCCVAYIPSFLHMGKTERGMFLFVAVGYAILMTLKLNEAAVFFVLAMAVISAVPCLRRLYDKAAQIPVRFIAGLKSELNSKGRYLHLLIAAAIALTVILLLTYVIINKSFVIIPVLLAAVAFWSVIAAISSSRNRRAISGALLSVCCIAVGVVFYNVSDFSNMAIYNTEIYDTVIEKGAAPNTFGRVSAINRDCENVTDHIPATEQEKDSEETLILDITSDESDEQPSAFLNAALNYDVADISIFRSTVNGDYKRFLARCGQDYNSIGSTGEISGFSGKEVLYSLFGVDTLYSGELCDFYYGYEPTNHVTYSDGTSAQFYRNLYALPAGVTYSSLMESERYEALNGAELPYAAMDSIYLEGYELPANAEVTQKEYSVECEHTLTQAFRGETSFGIKCYDNNIELKNDVTRHFLYLSFDGIKSATYSLTQSEQLTVNIDDRYERIFDIHNQQCTWEWAYSTDHYTLALGFIEEDVDNISFISPFEFESVTVYAVPEEVYTSAYSACTEEILENVELSTNTLTGDITVSKDKVLSVNILYSDGWRAYIDGEEAPIYKANGLFLGIPLSAGEHNVRLVYRSPWLYEGAVVSLAAVAIFIVLVVISRRRKDSKGAE